MFTSGTIAATLTRRDVILFDRRQTHWSTRDTHCACHQSCQGPSLRLRYQSPVGCLGLPRKASERVRAPGASYSVWKPSHGGLWKRGPTIH